MSSEETSAAEKKYEILLRVSQAATAELEISAVLEAVFRVLQPIVAIDMVHGRLNLRRLPSRSYRHRSESAESR